MVNGTGGKFCMNRVISEAFDMARNVRAHVSEICFIHGVPLADQFVDGAADLDHIPVDQRGRQQPQIANPLLLLVGIIFLNDTLSSELEPFRKRVVSFHGVGAGCNTTPQREIGNPAQ